MPRKVRTFADCPHKAAIQFCPLYVVAQSGKYCGMSCIDGAMESDYGTHCLVEREKMDYAASVEALRLVDPMLVAQCEFGKMKHDAQAQRTLNMRLSGVH